MKSFFLFAAFFLGTVLSFGQSNFNLDAASTFGDEQLKVLISNTIPNGYAQDSVVNFIFNGETYKLVNPPVQLDYAVPYQVTKGTVSYQLFFSPLPLINLNAYSYIDSSSDDLVPGKVQMADSSGFSYQSFIGIKVRGASSRTFPKKSYQIRLWTDSASAVTKDTSFWNMRSDEKWLLLAMWNEKLRLNNVFCEELWRTMAPLYYAAQEPDAQPGIRMKYVEVFLNGHYQGVYAFTENMDRKELKLKKTNNGVIRGELYKGVDWGTGLVNFYTDNTPPYDNQSLDWDGFEMEYPDDLPTDWSMLNDFAHFVNNSTNESFSQLIFNKFQKENAMNYFIFLNMVDAADNTGKNLFVAKYNTDEPYFYAPWDLDGTMGYDWTGERSNSSHQILSNHLFERLMTCNPDNYNTDIAAKWFALRDSLLAESTIDFRIDSIYTFLKNTGAYFREHIAWPDYQVDTNELNYTKTWVTSRLVVLDSFFNQITNSIYEPDSNISNNLTVSYDGHDFIIHLSGQLAYQSLDYQLFATDGRKLAEGMINAGQNRINVSYLPNSVYLIRFYDRGRRQIFTKKAVRYGN